MLLHLLEGITIMVIGIALAKLIKTIIHSQPKLSAFKQLNREHDKPKRALAKYPPALKSNQYAETYTYLAVVLLVSPVFASFELLPVWRYFTDILALFLVYDFLYYLTHRFLFHGNAYFRKVHGLHHQARNPSYIDSHYVHPLETFIGLSLLGGSVIIVGVLVGGFNVISLAVGLFIYSQINTLIHTQFDLPEFPFRTATWLVKKHHVHHENMNMGNYSSLLLLYDKMFGTLQ
jgi:sterol desaturase/sphingolipid hydroxylase (fatty acid hydroxylase superfamily)